MLQDIEFANSIYFEYEKYLEGSLKDRRFKHTDIVQLIHKLDKKIFTTTQLGRSVEGREIFRITAGTGKKKVLCWSQMHGDEPTATMALFDIFNFLSSQDNYDPIRNLLLKHLSFSFIPMLNPDGAEIFTRRNRGGIDINRDAAKLSTPEAQILNNEAVQFKPEFGFNLHDQDIHYTAGKCFKSAAISFLAPPSDIEQSINHIRLNAIKLISRLYKIMSVFIPGHIGKYKDDFEQRAFGDNFQNNGTSTILVESGGWKGDTEKQFVRKLNFILLLTAFKCISQENYKHESTDIYTNIPFNEIYLFDVLLKNLTLRSAGRDFTIDIGINLEEKTTRNGRNFYYEGRIADMGDLSIYYGYQEYNFADFDVSPGRTLKTQFSFSTLR